MRCLRAAQDVPPGSAMPLHEIYTHCGFWGGDCCPRHATPLHATPLHCASLAAAWRQPCIRVRCCCCNGCQPVYYEIRAWPELDATNRERVREIETEGTRERELGNCTAVAKVAHDIWTASSYIAIAFVVVVVIVIKLYRYTFVYICMCTCLLIIAKGDARFYWWLRSDSRVIWNTLIRF